MLKRENISYVVAPYEADAQMTFLAISNQVDAVLTEDSDLIPFGCPRVSYTEDTLVFFSFPNPIDILSCNLLLLFN